MKKLLAIALIAASIPAFAAIPRAKAGLRIQPATTSLIAPVYACAVKAGDQTLANVRLPERPEAGDFILGREILGVSVDWSGIVDGGSYTPSRIPCVVVVE